MNIVRTNLVFITLFMCAWLFFCFTTMQAEMKLKEEEQRAVRYLETRKGCDSVSVVSLGTMYSCNSLQFFLIMTEVAVETCPFE